MFPQLEEKLQALNQALNTATSESIIEQCKQHLGYMNVFKIVMELTVRKPVNGYLLLNLLKFWIACGQVSLALSRECSREAICI